MGKELAAAVAADGDQRGNACGAPTSTQRPRTTRSTSARLARQQLRSAADAPMNAARSAARAVVAAPCFQRATGVSRHDRRR